MQRGKDWRDPLRLLGPPLGMHGFAARRGAVATVLRRFAIENRI